MKHLTWTRLAALGGGALAVGWLVSMLALNSGRVPVAVPFTMTVVCLVGGAVSLALGWTVRAYKKGDRPHLDAGRAVATAAYAQACAYAGAVLAGGLVGYALALDWGHGPRRSIAIEALVSALAALALLVAGVVAERWCRTEDHDDDLDGPASGATV